LTVIAVYRGKGKIDVEMVLLCGIQATGKTSFAIERFAHTHELISLDLLKTHGKESALLQSCFQQRRPVVIDNTNVTAAGRQQYIKLAQDNGYAITGYYFNSDLSAALKRNKQREDIKPNAALRASFKKLDIPVFDEGYRQLFGITAHDGVFTLEEWMPFRPPPTGMEAIRQFLGIRWRGGKPYFWLYNPSMQEYEETPAAGEVRIEKLGKKICTGYYDLHDNKTHPCANQVELTHSPSGVCRTCGAMVGFRQCMMCRGDTCKAVCPDAVQLCKRDHILYLACFPGNKVKVGTTTMERRYERVLEQGAVYSMFIGKADGKEIRRMENAAAKLGITPQVTQKYKLKTIFQPMDKTTAEQVLTEHYELIKTSLPNAMSSQLIKPEFNNFDHTGIPDMHVFQKDTICETLENADKFEGEIIAIIGSIGLFRTGNKITAINMKEYAGWYITILPRTMVSENYIQNT
jgi:predicted kinase